jgi:thiol-disulfide isomerase/thioredoxin
MKFLASALVILALSACTAAREPRAGDTVPVATLRSLSGHSVHLDGKASLIVFFATWCNHCQDEIGTLNELTRVNGKAINIVGVEGSPIGSDRQSPSSAADVLAFRHRFHVVYPVVSYADGRPIADFFELRGFPTIALLDSDRRIRRVHAGYMHTSELSSWISQERQCAGATACSAR